MSTTTKDCSLIRFSDAMIPRSSRGRADGTGRAHAAGANGGEGVVADGGESAAGLNYAINLHQPMTYQVQAALLSRRQALARRRLQ